MLTKNEIALCIEFAYQVTELRRESYSKRNKKVSYEKMINDCFIGKLAELVVYYHLREQRLAVNYPDFTIDSNDYSADLKCKTANGKRNIHVKVCRHDSEIKESWLLEEKEIEKLTENCFFALCVFRSIEDIMIMKIIHHKNIPFKNPVYNLPTKKAIYLEDIV
jgi:hypothetical protein